jgi:hypothetical protein
MKKSILSATLVALFLLVLPITNSFGQPDIKARLLQNVVKTENGKFIAEEYGSIVNIKTNLLEVKITATAPADIISRDSFISIYSEMGISILSSALKDINIEPNEAFNLIRHGKSAEPPKVVIQIEMSKTGLSYKVNSGTSFSSSNTLSWDQFFSGKD